MANLQNASRIMRALFDIVLRRNNPILAGQFLRVSQMFERQMWYFETPLRQFVTLPHDIIDKIEQRDVSIEQLKEMDAKEIGKFGLGRMDFGFLIDDNQVRKVVK